jgi:predicted Zn-dependent protease
VLFDMHMMLGDTASAEIDAERSMAGTTGENDAGTFELAMLDLFSGRFTSGLHALIASADALDARGAHDAAARRRYDLARQAAQLGDRATATAVLARITGARPAVVGKAHVLALIVAGQLADARTAAAALPDATSERADAELLVADASHDDAGVLAASARLEQLATPVDLYATGEALIRGGRPDDAAAVFERMVHHPFAWTEPVATVRAWRELGRLRERAGDLDGARAAYAEVIAHWGNATTHMPEVDAARAALRAIKAR